jgi:peptide/nickel transport system permease protein
VLLAVAAAAVWGALAPPYDPLVQDFSLRLEGPSLAHPLGTDQFGRDVLSRLLVGAGPSLLVGTGSTALACALGIPVGAACAAGGRAGAGLSRLLDGVQAFPGLLLSLLLVAVVGPSYRTLILAIGVAFFPLLARVTEAVVATERGQEYALAARAVGLPPVRVLLHHVLPNGASALLVQATTVLALAILSEAALSFLGLGPALASPTWGRMLFDARATMELAPHTALAPLLAISLTVLAVNLLGDGLRDALDPVVASQRVA